jgi:hypothetical protein
MPIRPSERRKGFVLVAVLWLVTLLALQISIFNLTGRDAAPLPATNLLLPVRGGPGRRGVRAAARLRARGRSLACLHQGQLRRRSSLHHDQRRGLTVRYKRWTARLPGRSCGLSHAHSKS